MAIDLVVLPTGLRVQFTGAARLAAGSRGLDVPFERIVGSRVMTRGDAVASSPRFPCPGSWWPGRLRAGSWGIGERRQLWGVRRGTQVLVVYLSGRPFHRVVVDVGDPQRTHRDVEGALLHSKKNTARQSLRGLGDELGDDGLGSTRRSSLKDDLPRCGPRDAPPSASAGSSVGSTSSASQRRASQSA